MEEEKEVEEKKGEGKGREGGGEGGGGKRRQSSKSPHTKTKSVIIFTRSHTYKHAKIHHSREEISQMQRHGGMYTHKTPSDEFKVFEKMQGRARINQKMIRAKSRRASTSLHHMPQVE